MKKKKCLDICLNCQNFVEYEIKERKNSIILNDANIEYNEKYAICKNCGKEIYVKDISNENLEIIRNEYRK